MERKENNDKEKLQARQSTVKGTQTFILLENFQHFQKNFDLFLCVRLLVSSFFLDLNRTVGSYSELRFTIGFTLLFADDVLFLFYSIMFQTFVGWVLFQYFQHVIQVLT